MDDPASEAGNDDWFGEGNAFETLEDLAAAVAALAGPAAQPVAGVAPAEPPGAPV